MLEFIFWFAVGFAIGYIGMMYLWEALLKWKEDRAYKDD